MHMGAEATPSNPRTTVNNCHMSVQAPPCGVATECVTAGSARDWGVAPGRLGA